MAKQLKAMIGSLIPTEPKKKQSADDKPLKFGRKNPPGTYTDSIERMENMRKMKEAAQLKKEAGEYGRRGRPARPDKDNKSVSSAERGTIPGEMRKTYLVNIMLAKQLEAIARYDYKNQKELINEALASYVQAWEKKNGSVNEAMAAIKAKKRAKV
jgi:hypothetical protein